MVQYIRGEIMLEVVFSDSEKGFMKAAKNYNDKNIIGEAVSYAGEKTN